MAEPLVIKIGGSLIGAGRLREACAEVERLAERFAVLVVPGGGPFADAVRAADAALGLADAKAHALALGAMDQHGELLAGLLPAATRLRELRRPDGIALLVARDALGGRPEIPESWEVTSDSLAVFAAAAIGAREAILLKAAEAPLGDEAAIGAAELAALQALGGGEAVDRYLPTAVRATGVEVVVRSPSSRGTRVVA